MLYVFRGLAGVANGGIQALVMMILSDIVTLKKRAFYQGILGGIIGLANMVGPCLAAAFIHESTWRAFFWLISPLAALCGVGCYYILPTPKDAPNMNFKAVSAKVDYWGILAGSAAIVLILIPISGGGHYFSWNSPMVITMLTIGGACMLGFLYIEHKIALLPMMPCKFCSLKFTRISLTCTVSLFKNRPVCTMLLHNFCFGIVYYSQIYYLPLFFHNARGMLPLLSAALAMPISFGQIVASVASGHCISHFERYGYIIYAGFALWTLGVGLTILFNLNTPIADMVVITLIQGFGVGLILQPILTALQAHCTKAQRAVVISNRNFLRNLGGAVGLAISAATLQIALKKAMPPEFAPHGSSTYNVPDFDAIGATPAQILSVRQAYASASRTVFKVNAPIMGACLLGCLLIRDHGLQRPDEAQSAMNDEETVQAQGERPNEVDLKGITGQLWKMKPTNDIQETVQSKAQ
jgi:MFS family permease